MKTLLRFWHQKPFTIACTIIAVFVLVAFIKAQFITAKQTCFFYYDIASTNQNVASVLEKIKGEEFNCISAPVRWSDVETTEGTFDYALYDENVRAITDAGLDLIFLLDFSGRRLNASDKQSVPEWFLDRYENPWQIDFYNFSRDGGIDFSRTEFYPYIQSFIDHTVQHFQGSVGSQIIGYAPGFTHELEIKYIQENFEWSPYSDSAKKAFQDYLKEKYKTVEIVNVRWNRSFTDFSEIQPPLMNYGTDIAANYPVQDTSYGDFMAFRESLLVNFVQFFADRVHSYGASTVGYFGQFNAYHDGINGAWVLEKLVPYIDLAVVDFNFYDGLNTDLDPYVPYFMANYAKNLGYKDVMVGLYFERLQSDGEIRDVGVQAAALVASTVDHIEIGMGERVNNANAFESFDPIFRAFKDPANSRPKEDKKKSVLLFISKWNSYFWEGAIKNNFDFFKDITVNTFKGLEQSGLDVHIVSDENVLEMMDTYDGCVVVPSQNYMARATYDRFEKEMRNGRCFIFDYNPIIADEYGVGLPAIFPEVPNAKFPDQATQDIAVAFGDVTEKLPLDTDGTFYRGLSPLAYHTSSVTFGGTDLQDAGVLYLAQYLNTTIFGFPLQQLLFHGTESERENAKVVWDAILARYYKE